MIDLKNISNIYLIGIGGIGMSALARYFKQKGKTVTGYDKTETELTQQLAEEGIVVFYEDEISKVDIAADLVIYTPAIPKNNAIKNYYLQNEFTVLKRSEVLQSITQNYTTIAIAGTHGKTTITALTSWIATVSGIDATAFIGGICNNYNSNFKFGNSEYVIVEADEYDRSFLKLQPNYAIVSAIDADHLDIYKNYENVKLAFEDFVTKTENKVIKHTSVNLNNSLKTLNYGVKANGTKPIFYAYNITTVKGKQFFNLCLDGQHLKNISTILPGIYNIENAVAASAVNYLCGASLPKIKEGIESFEGIFRRFQYIINTESLVMIDDYAHHPKELQALISTSRTLYPDKKISILFQPHLYSRTKDFAKEFAESLDLADEVFITEIYPAREAPIEGVDSNIILKKIKNTNKEIIKKEKVLAAFYDKKFEVLLIAGAGDIDKLVAPLKNLLHPKTI